MENFYKDLKLFFGGSGKSSDGTLCGLRRRNLVKLLNQLRLNEASTRSELARQLGFDPKTVTNLMNFLLDKRLIVATGFESSSGGRPAERLMLNSAGAYAIGVDLGAYCLQTVLIDLSGNIKSSQNVILENQSNSDKILEQIIHSIETVFGSSDLSSWEKVAGIGFVAPGFIDRGKGIVGEAVNLPGWKDIAIRDYLEQRFAVPVKLEEASRAAALGELWFGLGRRTDNFVSLDLGYGIGVGIISNGRLHYGASETAGEIGHTTVKPNGLRCHCGKCGCLETIASGEAIARLSGYPSARAAAIAAQNGNTEVEKIFGEAGRYIGIAVSNLINILNPKMMILNGGLCKAEELLLEPFMKSLEQETMSRSWQAVKIERSRLGDMAGAQGAAMLPLAPLFEVDN